MSNQRKGETDVRFVGKFGMVYTCEHIMRKVGCSYSTAYQRIARANRGERSEDKLLVPLSYNGNEDPPPPGAAEILNQMSAVMGGWMSINEFLGYK